MKSLKKNKIRITITVVLIVLFVWANFYTVRKIAHYGIELYLYDKLLVAYQIGGMSGLKIELNKESSQGGMRGELAVVKKIKENLEGVEAPGDFLENIVKEKREKIKLFKNLRIAAFAFIGIMLLLRLAVNLSDRTDK